MCGICGILDTAGRPIDKNSLSAMGELLRHRGPDDAGSFLHTSPGPDPISVGLEHRRLSIIDLSTGHQPMFNETQEIAVVFNGEIYNYRELREVLLTKGHRFISDSDTEVLVHLYEECGEQFVEQLDGMFAIALWDARRKRLLLARDRVGKKPLYIYHRSNLLLFASEIKAILAHPAVERRIDDKQIPTYLIHGYIPTPQTFFGGISSLAPASVLLKDSLNPLKQWSYWDFPFHRSNQEAVLSIDEASSGLRHHLRQAVKKRLIADVPLGVLLSGGVDSSVVTRLVTEVSNHRAKTFSVGFPEDPSFDETAHARRVATEYQTDHVELQIEPKSLDLLDRLLWHYDEPFGDASAIPTYLVAELARQHVTVVLNGDGGDELFAGYLRFWGTEVAERIPSIALPLLQRLFALLPASTVVRSRNLLRAKRFLDRASLPYLPRYVSWISYFFAEELNQLMTDSIDGPHSMAQQLSVESAYLDRVQGCSRIQQLLYLNAKTYLLDDLLVKMDRMTMAHALEARAPFLDHHLIDYVSKLPDKFKLKGRQAKYLLKYAFRRELPRSILRRPKQGFGVPLDRWFRGELKVYLMERLLAAGLVLHRYVRRDRLESMLKLHFERKQDANLRIWLLLTLSVWLEKNSR